MSYLIKELPDYEKPREKFKKYGEKNLSNEELMAIILRTGTNELSVKDLAIKISTQLQDITNYQNWTISNLTKIKGMGEVKAITLLAAIELGRRTITTKDSYKIPINNAKVIYELYKYELQNLKQEHLIVLLLDTKKQLITSKTIFIGTINKIIVHPREVFYEAIKYCAASIILIHNHPSGDPTPSIEDKNFTNAIIKSSQIIQIPLIDHIIIGNNKYYSFYDNENGDVNETNS